MKTGSKSPLLPAVIPDTSSKKVQARQAPPVPVQRLRVWTEADGSDGIVLVVENMQSRKQTRMPMTYEQFGEFVGGHRVTLTPAKS